MKRVRFLLLAGLMGCSGGLQQFPVAKVTGKVVCDGNPVPNVRVYFAPYAKAESDPVVGKQGQGIAKADGTFVVSTYDSDDGAVVAKHSVSVTVPHPEDHPDFKCDCETSGKPLMDVEVTAKGPNEFTIELPKKKSKNASNFTPEQLEDIKKAKEAGGQPAPMK